MTPPCPYLTPDLRMRAHCLPLSPLEIRRKNSSTHEDKGKFGLLTFRPHRAMTWQRHFTRRRWFICCSLVVLYAGLWFPTQRFGPPQVRVAAVQAMRVPPNCIDVSGRTERITGPGYYCRSRAYAPLLVLADYGWHGGPLSGDGGSALYLWLFGRSFRIRELEHWSE